jgi:hypothetical protein
LVPVGSWAFGRPDAQAEGKREERLPATSRISEEGAAEQMRLLAMLGEDAAAMEEIEGYAGWTS